jgi:hypothetical protein
MEEDAMEYTPPVEDVSRRQRQREAEAAAAAEQRDQKVWASGSCTWNRGLTVGRKGEF